MKIQTHYPFGEYNGYIMINREDRKMVHLIHKESKQRTTISHARYLMSVKEKRILEKWEQVDHIDGNKKNDDIENLQILTAKQNCRKNFIQNNKTMKMIELKCPSCENNFIRELRNCHIQKSGHFTCCSRSCLHNFLKNGYSIKELKKVGRSQIIKQFRRDPSFYENE